jgi:ABC-type Co2+ transport system permease subunit
MANANRIGCLSYLAIGVGSMFVCGFVAYKFVAIFRPLTDEDIFSAQIALVAAIDALTITGTAYACSVEGAAARERMSLPRTFATFMALGMLCGDGYGIIGLILFGVINGLVGVVVWWVIVNRPRRSTVDIPNPPLTRRST